MKKTLYLLPGTMCDHRVWSYMMSALDKIAVEHYQYQFLTIENQSNIDDILRSIKHQLPNEKVYLIGFSLGGYLASAFAVKYPEYVERLFVVSNLPTLLPKEEVRERTRTVDWIKRNGYQGISQRRVLNLLDDTAHQNQEIIQLIVDMDACLGEEVLTHQLMVTTKRENLVESLRKLIIQKHFIVGQSDRLVTIDTLRKMVKLDPTMNLTILENTGHMVPLEKPKALAKWISEIIQPL